MKKKKLACILAASEGCKDKLAWAFRELESKQVPMHYKFYYHE